MNINLSFQNETKLQEQDNRSLLEIESAPENNVLTWDECRCKIKENSWFQRRPRNSKYLLENLTGRIFGGTSLAIMGPSGAGKSTFLNALALVSGSGKCYGRVELNGVKLTSAIFKRFCAYVPQEDHHPPFLTCREVIEFEASFQMCATALEREQRVNDLIRDLGLQACEHTRCGNQFLKGLSGGQKRRLSLALALVKRPTVLFLDELTSGLDSFTAEQIMVLVRRLARASSIAVISTIHQPSARVFNEFDRVLLLSGGRAVFSGPVTVVRSYFENIWGQVPVDRSTPEFLLELVNCDFGGQERRAQVDRLVAAWSTRQLLVPAEASEASNRQRPTTGMNPRGSGMVRQVGIHLRRQALMALRDPSFYAGRAALFLVCGVLFSAVYSQARVRNQAQVTNRMFLTVWLIAVPSCMGAVAVYALNNEFLGVRREVKNGAYTLGSYAVANAIFQVPMMVALSLASLGVSGYCISNMQPAGFIKVLGIHAATMWTFEMVAQLLSLVFAHPLLGILFFILYWFASFLFAGFFIAEDDILIPFKVFTYMTPLRWSIASLLKSDFMGTTFQGAHEVSPPSAGGQAFECDEGILVCYGQTGEQVLASMARTFTLFKPSDTYAQDLLTVVGIGAVIKTLCLILMYQRTSDSCMQEQQRRRRVITFPFDEGVTAASSRARSEASSDWEEEIMC